MRYFYNILTYLLIPFALMRLLWRSRKNAAYRQRWHERFAYITLAPNQQNGIWVHAVSLGEAIATTPLIRALQKQHPNLPITVTSMTITGSERIQAALGNSVYHVYVPYDCPSFVKRFLDRVQPRLAIIMETELWPNLLTYTHQRSIPILLANARLSLRSMTGYQRFSRFITPVLQNMSLIAAQSVEDQERFHKLGMPLDQIVLTGNIKFDLAVPPSTIEGGELLRQQLGADRPIWIASSTHPGEEEIILKAFQIIKKTLPNCLLILVPRHPERFASVADLCRQHHHEIVLRSSGKPCSIKTDIFLGDSMGEMLLFYAASDVALVGGSLVHIGGHNLLEPAALKLPLLSGPHLFNFAEISKLLLAAHALTIIQNANDLAQQIIRFLQDPNLRHSEGSKAFDVVQKNRGALVRHLALVDQLLAKTT